MRAAVGGALSSRRPWAQREDLSEGALDWTVPSPRLRMFRRYEVAATTLAVLALALVITLALGSRDAAELAVVAFR